MVEQLRLDEEAFIREPSAQGAEPLLARIIEAIQDDPAHTTFRDDLFAGLKRRVQQHPDDVQARFALGVLYKGLKLLDHAIEQFMATREVRELALKSHHMMGRCFAEKQGFCMEDLAIRQFQKGLESKGFRDEEYQELRYDLAMLYVRRGEYQEACNLFTDIYCVDVHYRDVAEWCRWCEGGHPPPHPEPAGPRPPAGSIALGLPRDPLDVLPQPRPHEETA